MFFPKSPKTFFSKIATNPIFSGENPPNFPQKAENYPLKVCSFLAKVELFSAKIRLKINDFQNCMAKSPKKLFRKSKKISSRVRKIFAKPGNFASKIRRVIPKVLKVFRQRLTNFAISQQIFVDCPRILRQQSGSYQKKSAVFFKIPKEFQQNPKKLPNFR